MRDTRLVSVSFLFCLRVLLYRAKSLPVFCFLFLACARPQPSRPTFSLSGTCYTYIYTPSKSLLFSLSLRRAAICRRGKGEEGEEETVDKSITASPRGPSSFPSNRRQGSQKRDSFGPPPPQRKRVQQKLFPPSCTRLKADKYLTQLDQFKSSLPLTQFSHPFIMGTLLFGDEFQTFFPPLLLLFCVVSWRSKTFLPLLPYFLLRTEAAAAAKVGIFVGTRKELVRWTAEGRPRKKERRSRPLIPPPLLSPRGANYQTGRSQRECKKGPLLF